MALSVAGARLFAASETSATLRANGSSFLKIKVHGPRGEQVVGRGPRGGSTCQHGLMLKPLLCGQGDACACVHASASAVLSKWAPHSGAYMAL